MRPLPELTGLRGFAAFYVLLLHIVVIYGFTHAVPGAPDVLFRFGWIGVDLFFVLSGFLLSLPLFARPQSLGEPGFFRAYMAKRWWRIAPPFYLAMIVALALAGRLSYLWQAPLDIFFHVTFLHSLRPESFGTIDPVYWTLGSEFQFYLLLPLFVLLLRQRQWWAGVALLGATTLIWRGLTWEGPREGAWLSFTLPAFLLHFALGILAARFFVAGRRSPVPARWAIPAVALALIVVPLVTFREPAYFQGDGTWLSNLLLRPLLAAGFAALVFLVCSETSAWSRLFRTRPMQALGESSYSLYLVHAPVLTLLAKSAPLMDMGFGAYLAAGLVIPLAAAGVFYLLVERPSLVVREWMVSRRKSPQANPVPVAAAAILLPPESNASA